MLNIATCCALLLITVSNAIPRSLLYDYKLNKNLAKGDDVSSSAINLKIPIVFYGTTYDRIYINSNGILSFATDLNTFFNIEFPLDYPIIAPLYSNVDTSGTGDIFYIETGDRGTLARADQTISDAFPDHANFETKSVFIVTWLDVGYHSNGIDKQNTFQVAIYSDGYDSFVEFLYADNGIQWIQSMGDKSGLPDARAQAGLASFDGRFYNLPGSGTDQVVFLDRRSNMNLPGQWLFHVGKINREVNIELPKAFNSRSPDHFVPTTCATAMTYCNIQAKCIDYEQGFCCHCKKGYYGNGKTCIKKDLPLRVNGKVNLKMKEDSMDNIDLQSYVVMEDARAYTAMSKIPTSIAADMQAAQIMGSTIAWLFAKPIGEALNGFQLTGGTFNHSATVTFPNTNQNLHIRQKFLGLDAFGQLKLEAEISGEVPALPAEKQVSINEYAEEYTITAPGVIQSSSSHMFTYEQLGIDFSVPYKIEQHFIYTHCKGKFMPPGTTWKLKSGKNFISYEDREQIVRFGLSSKIGPLGDIDPCEVGRETCGVHSSCVVEDDTFRCVCNPGYQQLFVNNEEVCEDINECTHGVHDCDYNAQCENVQGGFQCNCNPGFEGNGRVCENARSCHNVTCNTDAECVETHGYAVCACMPGFTGNGFSCSPIQTQSCNIANNCSPFGVCSIDPESNVYSCQCLPNFEGNGYDCSPLPTEGPSSTEVEPSEYPPEQNTPIPTGYVEQSCFLANCWCPSDYEKVESSSYCAPKANLINEDAQTDSCNTLSDCSTSGKCLFMKNGHYECVCKYGYTGDGYDCTEVATPCTEEEDMCDHHASCSYDDHLDTSVCKCNEGYQGDGLTCTTTPICRSSYDCYENEECGFSRQVDGFDCICKKGWARDSQHLCVRMEGTCGGGKCVENAECLYDDAEGIHYCQCKSGYDGDGISKCTQKPQTCDLMNNCGLHATCVYSPHGYTCICDEGFEGDGIVCYVEQSCHIDPHLCDPNARCVADVNRKYACECNPGYDGNGTTCFERLKHEGNFLLVNQGIATLKLAYDPNKKNGRPIQLKPSQLAVGLDVDCLGGRIYWSDISLRAIRSASYNGSDKEDFITADIGSPEGLAIDWIARNIYWTDSLKDTIEVANMETKLRRILINTSLVNPRGIAVHPQRGKIFWSDWNRANPKVEWANEDGTGRQIFIAAKEFVGLPNSLTVDYHGEQLCYADAGVKKIVCVGIDSRLPTVQASECAYPFGIAVTPEHIYWSDWISKKIERVEKYTKKRLDALTVPLGGTGNKLYALITVPDNCPSLTNLCYYFKDQCAANKICFPDGKNSRTCLCGQPINSTEGSKCSDSNEVSSYTF